MLPNMLVESLRHCLTRLTTFSGRDRPRQFWPYAGLVLGAGMAVWMVGVVQAMQGTFGKMQQFARAHPDQVTVTQGPGHYSMRIHGHHPELMPDFAGLIGLMAVIVLAVAILLGAAITRRMHDSDLRGALALIPLALLASGFALIAPLFDSVAQGGDFPAGRFTLAFTNNLAYLASLGALFYALVRKGTPGPNRFGTPPA